LQGGKPAEGCVSGECKSGGDLGDPIGGVAAEDLDSEALALKRVNFAGGVLAEGLLKAEGGKELSVTGENRGMR
jgi:hypothetical protein